MPAHSLTFFSLRHVPDCPAAWFEHISSCSNPAPSLPALFWSALRCPFPVFVYTPPRWISKVNNPRWSSKHSSHERDAHPASVVQPGQRHRSRSSSPHTTATAAASSAAAASSSRSTPSRQGLLPGTATAPHALAAAASAGYSRGPAVHDPSAVATMRAMQQQQQRVLHGGSAPAFAKAHFMQGMRHPGPPAGLPQQRHMPWAGAATPGAAAGGPLLPPAAAMHPPSASAVAMQRMRQQ
jgi:hypothetical protein